MNVRCTIPLLILFSSLPVSADEQPAIDGFLKAHCCDCHTGDSAQAGLDLQQLQGELNSANFEQWVHIVNRVRSGEMPPKESSTVKVGDAIAFVNGTSNWLNQHQTAEHQALGRVRARRLTNMQLERTLQDLLGIDIPLALQMPDEPRTHGFASVASGQSVSHFQLQTHLSVVDAALDEAFARATGGSDEWSKDLNANAIARKHPKRRCREPEILDGNAVVWASNLIFYSRLPVTTARHDGWYRIKINASALNLPEDHGVWCSVRIGQCVSGSPMLAWSGAFEATEQPQEWTFEAWLNKGDMFEIRPADNTLEMARFAGGQVGAGEGEPQKVAGLAIHSMQLEQFHKGPSNSDVRQQLLGDLAVKPSGRGRDVTLTSTAPKQDIIHLMTDFAERAFRRPVSDDVIQPYVQLVLQSLENNTPLLQALRGGYRAVLCSPRFIYFQEEPGTLDDYAFASRLSYLLWSSMPDEHLISEAKSGQLRKPDVLREQVERMLKDPRGHNFVKDFAREWLDLSQIDFTEPDRKLYSGFDVVVQESMLQETQTFLQEMIDKDLSVTNLIDSDFTFLNSRLARYYKIADVKGDQIRRVPLRQEDNRGGVLTQGAILKVTANGTTTSPVIRGVWISERLLGEEIPPPPFSVPAIEPDIRGAKTIREMLAKHTSDTSCASCHQKIDPPGFALENYDPSGRWRDKYLMVSGGRRTTGAKIDPAHQMPGGETFSTLRDFQNLIIQDRKALAKNVVQQLLTYGTGAPCAFVDREAVNKIVDETKHSNYGMKSLLNAVVESKIMQTK